MTTLSQIADEIGRLRLGGVARFHFDPRHVPPRPLDDARLDAWTCGRLDSLEARSALSAAVIADTLAPNVEDGVRRPMTEEITGMARVALRSIEAEFAEHGVEIDTHAGLAKPLSAFVFLLVRMVASERVSSAGHRSGSGDPFVDALLGEGFAAMQAQAVTLRGHIVRLLRSEAAMNLAYDALVDGDVPAMQGGLRSVLDEMPPDDPIHGSILRILKAVERG